MEIDLGPFFQMLFLLAPAGVANMAPVWAANIWPQFSQPIDGGLKYRGQRLLGANKTWRGLIAGVLTGILIGIVQLFLVKTNSWFLEVSQINHSGLNFLVLGGFLGFFALFGDALKSLFKRRLKIQPGKPWPPFDQIDYVIGAYIFIFIFFSLSWQHYLIGLITYALLHPVISYSAYLLNLKKDKF